MRLVWHLILTWVLHMWALHHLPLLRGLPWVIDSGTSNHVTGIRYGFTLYTRSPSLGTVKVANGNHTEVLGEGTIDVYNTLSSIASTDLEMFFLKFF